MKENSFISHLAFGEFSLWSFLLPSKKRRNGNEPAENPNGSDHDDDPLGCSFAQVLYGVRDGPVPVQADETKVHDAGCAEEDVHGGMDVAPPLTENPVTHHLFGQWEGHDDEAEEAVGHGQRAYEPVLNALKRTFGEDGDDDQRVSSHNHNHNDGDKDGSYEQTQRGVTTWVDDARPPRLFPAARSIDAGQGSVQRRRRPVENANVTLVHGQHIGRNQFSFHVRTEKSCCRSHRRRHPLLHSLWRQSKQIWEKLSIRN